MLHDLMLNKHAESGKESFTVSIHNVRIQIQWGHELFCVT